MRFASIERVLFAGLITAMVQVVPTDASFAVSDGNYDGFDSVTLNDVDGAAAEIPYVGPARQFESLVFDTSTFTLEAGENDTAGSLNSCVKPGPTVVYAGRTGWVRFNPGVNGRIDVLAETPGYNSVLMVRTALDVPWHAATFGYLQGLQACADQMGSSGNEGVTGFPVTADRVYYVQVGGVCAGGPATCGDPSTPGGPTRIRVSFTPFDTDGDGVPDSLDNCEGAGGPRSVTTDGCPDADADGVGDAVDDCLTAPGVPAPAPYNGCPAGPVPPDPANTPYVRIESLKGDAYSTPSRRVKLLLNWPKGTVSALISNQNATIRTKTVSSVVIWLLRPAKHPAERGVRVRFRGPHVSDVIVGDTIIVDPTAPEVSEAVLLPFGEGWYVGLTAEDPGTDRDPGTGISAVALLDESMKLIDEQLLCNRDQCEKDVDIALSTLLIQPAFIQVVDPAGNIQVQPLPETTAASLNCAFLLVPYRTPPSGVECVQIGQRCGKLKPLLRWRVTEVRCRSLDGVHYRVVHM
jgi:hypothetical protein